LTTIAYNCVIRITSSRFALADIQRVSEVCDLVVPDLREP